MNRLDGVKLRDPQDTFLLVCVLVVAVVVALTEVDPSNPVVAAAVAGVLTKIGTTGAQAGGTDG